MDDTYSVNFCSIYEYVILPLSMIIPSLSVTVLLSDHQIVLSTSFDSQAKLARDLLTPYPFFGAELEFTAYYAIPQARQPRFTSLMAFTSSLSVSVAGCGYVRDEASDGGVNIFLLIGCLGRVLGILNN